MEGVANERLPEQPSNSLLCFISVSGKHTSNKDHTHYEMVCECDGSFCGTHEGRCGNIRLLNSISIRRGLACKRCTQAHGGLLLSESARQRRVPDSPEIDEALRKVYRQPHDQDPYGSTYPRSTLNHLAVRFKRTRNYMRRRAEELNLTRRIVKSYPKWTDQEEKIVERFAHLSPTVIHKKLKREGYERTPTAIRDRIYLLRLREDSDYYSQERLAKHLGVTSSLGSRWAKERLLRGQNLQTGNPTDTWRVHRKEIRRFIQRNPNAIDLCKVEQMWFLDIVFEGEIAETAEAVLRKKKGRRPKPSPAEQLEMFTYHEAGHAVMAHIQHARVKPLAVGKRDDSSKKLAAHPENDWHRSAETRTQVERQILILFAGQIAQNIFTGRHGRGAESAQAKMLASRVASEKRERKAYLNWLWLRALNMLSDEANKTAVQILAQALRSEPEVCGVRIMPARQAKIIIETVLSE
jgi:hypothetical protein